MSNNEEMQVINTQRVAYCEKSENEVVQQWTGTEWLCLHNETVMEDMEDVVLFKHRNKREEDPSDNCSF